MATQYTSQIGMSLNRKELATKISITTSGLLKEKGYICFTDLFQNLGYLSKEDYESWRKGQVPYLERVIRVNLMRINYIMKLVVKNSRNGKLRESRTFYKKWGKGPKHELRFSKSGRPQTEKMYATHFVKSTNAKDMKAYVAFPYQ